MKAALLIAAICLGGCCCQHKREAYSREWPYPVELPGQEDVYEQADISAVVEAK